MPCALDNGQRAPRTLLAAVVRRFVAVLKNGPLLLQLILLLAGCSGGQDERSEIPEAQGGSKIAFALYAQNESDPDPDVLSSADTEIYVINPDGTGLTRVTDNYDGDGFPRWSPDNTRIADVTLEGGLFVSEPDGSAQIRLTDNAYGAAGLFDWSPDGSMIVYSGFGPGKTVGDLWMTQTDGGGTAVVPVRGLKSVFAPVWSPDGAKIAFLGLEKGKRPSSGLYLVDSDGGGAIMLARGDIERPLWSPDGTKVAFRRYPPRPGIYVVNRDGSGLRRVTDGRFDNEQVWSPDGTMIAFVRYPHEFANGGAIYGVRVETGGLFALTKDFQSREPTWSPDGAKIAFIGPAVGKHAIDIIEGGEVYVMNADGGGRRVITHTAGKASAPAWSSGRVS